MPRGSHGPIATYQAAFVLDDGEVTVIRDIHAGVSGPSGSYPANDLKAAEHALFNAGYLVASEWDGPTANGGRWCRLTNMA